jgi:hypothetical protein
MRATGEGPFHSAYAAVGNAVGKNAGATDVEDALSGKDKDGNQLSRSERAWAGISGVAQFAFTATGLKAAGTAVFKAGLPGLASLFGRPAPSSIGQNTVTRYVGPVEARIAQETGFIPNVDRFGNPKTVFVTPEAPLGSASQAESLYRIGAQNPFGPTSTPTHVIIGNPRGVPFDYGGIVEGSTGVEMTTRAQIPVIGVRPIGGK